MRGRLGSWVAVAMLLVLLAGQAAAVRPAAAHHAAIGQRAVGGALGATGRDPFQDLMAYVLAIGLLLTVLAVLGLRACVRPGASRTFRRYRP